MTRLTNKYGKYHISLAIRLLSIIVFTGIGIWRMFFDLGGGIAIIIQTFVIGLYIWEWSYQYKKIETIAMLEAL